MEFIHLDPTSGIFYFYNVKIKQFIRIILLNLIIIRINQDSWKFHLILVQIKNCNPFNC